MWWSRWFRKSTPEERGNRRADALAQYLDETRRCRTDSEFAAELPKMFQGKALEEAWRRYDVFSLWCAHQALRTAVQERPILMEWLIHLLEVAIRNMASSGEIEPIQLVMDRMSDFERAFNTTTPYCPGATPAASAVYYLSKEAWNFVFPILPSFFTNISLLEGREGLIVAPSDLLLDYIRIAKRIFGSVE